MSRLDSPQQQPGGDHARVGSGTISISPTRRQIDNKFPELGFDINIGDLPFYEVLLTTNRELFNPDRQQHRNRSNFHVSRWDTEPPRLTRAVGRPARYMVPPAVLQAFAQTKPKAIFYTLIAYAGDEGRDPVFAHDPARLPAEAPSVEVLGEFTGQTLSSVLGIPTHMLRRVGDPSPAASQSYDSRGFASADDDAGEGEDGYQVAAQGLSGGWNDDDGWDTAEAYAASDEDNDGPQDGYELQKAQSYDGGSRAAEWDDDDSEPFSYGEDDSYSDGYEDAGPIWRASALESVFPAEMGQPEDLNDSEGGYDGGGLSSGEDEYDYAASLSAEPEIDADASALEEDDEDYMSEPSYAAAYGGNGNGNGHAYAASAPYAEQYAAEERGYDLRRQARAWSIGTPQGNWRQLNGPDPNRTLPQQH